MHPAPLNSVWPGRVCRWQVTLCLLLALGWLSGCGYSTRELFPEQYRTVAVPIFENRTFYRDVEFELSEALIKAIELRTPYKVVSPAQADTLLEGVVVSVTQQQIHRTRSAGLPEVMEVRVSVDFRWKDLASGQIIRDRSGFVAVGQYRPTRPVGETVAEALHQVVDSLAAEIVSTLRADW